MGQIQSERSKKVGSMIATPLYGTSSDGTYVFDFGGAVRRIEIHGEICLASRTGANGLAQSARELDALINGQQDANAIPYPYPLIYKSDMILQADLSTQNPINCKVETGEWWWVYGETGRIFYTLTLIECKAGI